MSNIAIIIDVWKYRTDPFSLNDDTSVNPIIDFLNSGVIDTAILASYECYQELSFKKIWFAQRRVPQRVLDVEKLSTSKQQTHDKLLNYANKNIRQLSMKYISELEEIVKPKDSIYMLGGAFEVCLKNRELGYVAIKNHFPNNPVLINITCVLTADWIIPDMLEYPDWKKISHNVYEYIP